MTTNFWIVLWKIVLIGGLTLFSVMAVWVAIGGFFDVKRLFAQLNKEHEEHPDEEE